MIKPENEPMFAKLRKREIIKFVYNAGNVTVAELCERFNVSPATIRNDLRELEDAGALERTHGGAIRNLKAHYELDTYQKEEQSVPEKEGIAEIAVSQIKPGDIIALDTGTTTFQLAKQLVNIPNLTVITFDLQIASWLEHGPDIEIILAGGVVRRNFHYTTGQATLDTINRFNIDKAFLAANGVSAEKGPSTHSFDLAATKKAIINQSDKRYLLVDSSKIGVKTFAIIAPMEEIDVLITNEGADSDQLKAIKEKNVDIMIAYNTR